MTDDPNEVVVEPDAADPAEEETKPTAPPVPEVHVIPEVGSTSTIKTSTIVTGS